MKRRLATGGGVALILLLLGVVLLLELRGGGTEEASPRAGADLPETRIVASPETAPAPPENAAPSGEELHAGAVTAEETEPEPRASDRPFDIEEIKQQVYQREIESVDRLHLLDELVRTGDADTRRFWGDDWSGVDDWKRSSNGFSLEKVDDGTLIFIPDEETARTYTFFENLEVYTYDEVNRAFVNEIDYYGKTIFNVIKFLNDDVLAMMTISGRKVDLNLYQRDSGQR
jgi:hypothetical protein